MEKEGGNRERMRKCRESISLHFLIFSPFPPHFLILSPFPLRFLFISSFSLHFLATRLQGCNDSRSPEYQGFEKQPERTWCFGICPRVTPKCKDTFRALNQYERCCQYPLGTTQATKIQNFSSFKLDYAGVPEFHGFQFQKQRCSDELEEIKISHRTSNSDFSRFRDTAFCQELTPTICQGLTPTKWKNPSGFSFSY